MMKKKKGEHESMMCYDYDLAGGSGALLTDIINVLLLYSLKNKYFCHHQSSSSYDFDGHLIIN